MLEFNLSISTQARDMCAELARRHNQLNRMASKGFPNIREKNCQSYLRLSPQGYL